MTSLRLPGRTDRMLFEADHGYRRVQCVQFSDLGLFAVFVILGVFDRQTHRADIIVKRLAIDAGDANKSAEADS